MCYHLLQQIHGLMSKHTCTHTQPYNDVSWQTMISQPDQKADSGTLWIIWNCKILPSHCYKPFWQSGLGSPRSPLKHGSKIPDNPVEHPWSDWLLGFERKQFSSEFDSAGCQYMLPSSKSFLLPMSNRLDLGVSRTNMTNLTVQPARFTPYLILASRYPFELWTMEFILFSLVS